MRAARIMRFGGPEVIEVQDIAMPSPGRNEVLVRVAAAGVGPWDAIIREGKSKVSPQPPLTLGSDLAGVVEDVGDGVTELRAGDAVYGVTNPQFVGAQAEYAVCHAEMLAAKPSMLDEMQAASAPVIAVTAWQMLFEYARVKRGGSVLVLGAAGNVGIYAVQMAASAGVIVAALVHSSNEEGLRSLGASVVVDSSKPEYTRELPRVDAILDLVGGETLEQCAGALKSGGRLVSVVQSEGLPKPEGTESVFFYADVTTARLRRVTEMFESRQITARVGSVLGLEEVRRAHEMLAGAPHEPGKIMLRIR